MFSSPAFAQAAGSAPSQGFAFVQFIPFVLIIVIMWFLIIRPQQQKMKRHKTMIDGIKKGDTVVTAGGMVGKVVKADEHEVEVEIAPNVRVRVVKSTLGEVRGATVANDRA